MNENSILNRLKKRGSSSEQRPSSFSAIKARVMNSKTPSVQPKNNVTTERDASVNSNVKRDSLYVKQRTKSVNNSRMSI